MYWSIDWDYMKIGPDWGKEKPNKWFDYRKARAGPGLWYNLLPLVWVGMIGGLSRWLCTRTSREKKNKKRKPTQNQNKGILNEGTSVNSNANDKQVTTTERKRIFQTQSMDKWKEMSRFWFKPKWISIQPQNSFYTTKILKCCMEIEYYFWEF